MPGAGRGLPGVADEGELSAHGTGILPRQVLARLVAEGAIAGATAVAADQLQPASLDLRLGRVAHRIRASFLPARGESVDRRLDPLTLHTIDISAGAVLETGCVYLVPLEERLALPGDLSATTNPKSSTGRLDVFTRVICDGGAAFDRIPAGYAGPLYAEISPRTFPVLVRSGSRLCQIRLRHGDSTIPDDALAALSEREPLVAGGSARIDGGLLVSIDLRPGRPGDLVGWRARRHTGVVDVDRRDAYRVEDFWEPVAARPEGLILDPDEFYILVSREAVRIPPGLAAEMVPFDPMVGEFRVHYAGFFDPGFGYGPAGEGSRAVLEVRSREVPFMLEHGQVVARLAYECLAEPPDVLYGEALASHYQSQNLKLSKHFRDG